jgi:hypothetical protein
MWRALPVRRLSVAVCVSLMVVVGGVLPAAAQTAATASKVTVGSPSGLTPRNHQNEPAVAIDAHNPDVLVAGSNDYIDQQPCPHDLAVSIGSCLPAGRTNAGVSGVYFSFDRGHSWTQPSYTGWTLRDCSPADGPAPVMSARSGPCPGTTSRDWSPSATRRSRSAPARTPGATSPGTTAPGSTTPT